MATLSPFALQSHYVIRRTLVEPKQNATMIMPNSTIL